MILTTLTLFSLILSTGCAPVTPKYHVTVDAITAPNEVIASSSYFLKPLSKNMDSNNLKFQQYAVPLNKVLAERGYNISTNGAYAPQTIYFDYGIDKVNEETETYSEPNISFGFGMGYPFGGYYGGHPFFHDYYGGGYTTYRKTKIYYNRYISLLAKDQNSRELWRVDVSSIGESKNLRKIIPILIEATKPYIGTSTPEPIQLVIKGETPKKK